MKKINKKETNHGNYVVNFFATPVINYSFLISEQAEKEYSNPIYNK